MIGRSGSACKVLLLFVTDGESLTPKREVDALLSDYGSNIHSLTCVGLGVNTRALDDIGQRFEQKGALFRSVEVGDESALVQTFVEEASASLSIHT